MPSSSRSSRQQRSRRNRIAKSPEALEQRRLLDGDGGQIWIDPFNDYNGDGIQQSSYFEDYRRFRPEEAVYKDDGDGSFNSELDERLETNSGDLYRDLDFGRYFAVGQGYQSSTGVQTVLTTPAVQVLDLNAENPIRHAQFGYWSTGTLNLTVFYDTNVNGVRDEGESLVEGETTILVRDADEAIFHESLVTDGTNGEHWWNGDGAIQIFSIGSDRDDGLVATTEDPVTIVYEAGMRETAEFGVVDGASIQIIGYSDTTGDGRTADDVGTSLRGGVHQPLRWKATASVHGARCAAGGSGIPSV